MLNRLRLMATLLTLGLFVSACADGGNDAAGTPPVAAPGDGDIATLMATADPARGQVQFLQCRACHSLEAGGANKVGPNLHGMFGRKAGLAPGFAYSDVLAQSDVVWTVETLNEWLARPGDFLPGNRMVFVGIRKAADRADLIAYLQQETGAE